MQDGRGKDQTGYPRTHSSKGDMACPLSQIQPCFFLEPADSLGSGIDGGKRPSQITRRMTAHANEVLDVAEDRESKNPGLG
jgi:hypothetical protein